MEERREKINQKIQKEEQLRNEIIKKANDLGYFPVVEMGDYGEVCSINDVIGILYDCRENGVNISFYRNKKNLGIAFNGLPNDLGYFPVVEMGYCGSKVQIFNEIDFPEDK